MDVRKFLQAGNCREESFLVEEMHTAYHIGSGDEQVLGTPWMISFMERVSNRLVSENLPQGTISVGIHVDVKHLAATPVNCRIRVRIEILEVKRNRVLIKVEAWDSVDKIGEGHHQRAVVDKEDFMRRVMAKKSD